ncbi:MAG: porphobilinogen synthase [Bacteriovoracaceae bacterium]|jgi:porphobilinogen synthase|nr:porphobilinogen synthase [Bacteriovoracaceae bacterium]
MLRRPRRNRSNFAIRELVSEVDVTANDLIAPLFVIDGQNKKVEVHSMPGQFRFSIDLLLEEVKTLSELGVKAVAIFPAIDEELKTSCAKESFNEDNLNCKAIRAIKEKFPHMLVMADVAMDPYSSDGHDGVVKDGKILNDETLDVLAKMSIASAKAGADIVGPSDMMDGRIAYIRSALDSSGFKNVSIMSYTAKYASAFYGPFRDALDSAPKAGDKKTYQMDFRNSSEAMLELDLDTQEGADIVMVKPALSYMDIITKFKQNTTLPVAAYNVSGEYAMVMAAAKAGYVDRQSIMIEMLTSFKRAGADIILTYFAKDMATYLKNN